MRVFTLIATIVLSAAAASCGSEEPSKNNGTTSSNNQTVPDAAGDTGTPEPDLDQPDVGPPDDLGPPDVGPPDLGPPDVGPDMADTDMGGPCSRNGYTLVQQAVDWDAANGFFIYSGFNGDRMPGVPFDKLSFEIYPDFGGIVDAQNFTFLGQNYSDCGTCLLIFADCMQGVGCDKTFLVDSGSVAVAAAGTNQDDPFAATFSDLVFSEITFDPDTFVSTPVPGGETYCINMLDASGTTVVGN